MNLRRIAIFVTIAAFFVGLARPNLAVAQGNEAEGRKHFKAGQDLYRQGRFLDAAREFEEGYRVAPRPLFLLNIGHAYRRAQRLREAKEAYERLLTLQPNFERRVEVEGHLSTINDALQASEPPVPAPEPPPPAAPPRTTPEEAAGSVLSANPSLSARPPGEPDAVATRSTMDDSDADERPSDSIFGKTWFWVVVGTVVAGGVAVGIVATRPRSSCPGTLCISERQP